ncbi:MAG TPA: YdeI/OmpD-associated family protein [Rudaea sp.]|jgi:uncharacterized protein YdeI (YjbR/CyaY-like superfamily)|nr:YdeI/OmpD-associated family protein [Rudaea sp.]
MGNKDPRVDAYIANSADFAKPILEHLRTIVHRACPDVEETIKWRFPTFMYRGMLCGMAAFKQHCTFGFWKQGLVVGEKAATGDAMGQFGQLRSVADLPSASVLAGYVRKAMKLNEEGVKLPRPAKPKAPAAVAPDDLLVALAKNRKAKATFEGFSPSHRREYVEWIVEAKRPETRTRRIEQAVEWLAEGKPRNWKYMNC